MLVWVFFTINAIFLLVLEGQGFDHFYPKQIEGILFPIPPIAQKCTHMYSIYILVNNLIENGSTTHMSIARDVIKKATESYYPAAPPQKPEDQPFLHTLPHQLHHMRS